MLRQLSQACPPIFNGSRDPRVTPSHSPRVASGRRTRLSCAEFCDEFDGLYVVTLLLKAIHEAYSLGCLQDCARMIVQRKWRCSWALYPESDLKVVKFYTLGIIASFLWYGNM